MSTTNGTQVQHTPETDACWFDGMAVIEEQAVAGWERILADSDFVSEMDEAKREIATRGERAARLRRAAAALRAAPDLLADLRAAVAHHDLAFHGPGTTCDNPPGSTVSAAPVLRLITCVRTSAAIEGLTHRVPPCRGSPPRAAGCRAGVRSDWGWGCR